MTSPATPTTDKKLHPAFNGLSERQVAAIYKEDRVRQLTPGECLFSDGDIDRNTYLVIRGRLQVQQARGDVIYPITVIDNQGTITRDQFAANAQGAKSATAIAREPVTVLTIDDAALTTLDQETLVALYRNLSRDQSLEINQLLSRHADLEQKYTHISQEMTASILGRASHYANSNAIQGLLKRVPKLPPYASQLTGMLLSEDVSAREVTDLARLDPSLTSAVLKKVNSAYYGLNQKVTDFQHASLLLGFNQIYQIIIHLGIQKTMPNTGQFKRLQAHSVLISVLCFEISQATQSGNGPVMNTIGLLHDIGKSVLLLLISQNPKLAFFISMLDSDRIGALLLQNWDIPDAIYRPLEFQKHPELLPPEAIPDDCRKKVAILYLAHLCHDFMQGKAEAKLPVSFLPDYFRLLGIREHTLEQFIRKSLLKAVGKRLSSYPQDVQHFFNNPPGLIPASATLATDAAA